MKRSKHLKPLSHDHYEGLVVVGRLEQGVKEKALPAVMSDYVSHFWNTRLERHFRHEEALLLPLLDKPATEQLAERMVEEHRLIRDLVPSTQEHAGESLSVEKLAELARLMKAHTRFEERKLFPALEKEVTEKELRKVGARLRETHEEADLSWSPAFWT